MKCNYTKNALTKCQLKQKVIVKFIVAHFADLNNLSYLIHIRYLNFILIVNFYNLMIISSYY